jgi:alpha-L-arabinofuranosidase
LPFAQWSNHGRLRVLRVEIDSPSYETNYYDPRGPQDLYFAITAPNLKLAAVQSQDGVTLFAVNRSLDEALPLDVTATGFGTLRLHEALELHHPDLQAFYTKDPDRVKQVPLSGVRIEGDRVYAILAPASWTMMRLATAS